MANQTPQKHVTSPVKPKRYAHRRVVTMMPKRNRPKMIFKGTPKRRKRTFYKTFKKTSREYCAALLQNSLSRMAETHSNNLARLKAPPTLRVITPAPSNSASRPIAASATSNPTAHLSSPLHSSLDALPSASPAKTDAERDLSNRANRTNDTNPATSPSSKHTGNPTAFEFLWKLIQPLDIPSADGLSASDFIHAKNLPFPTSSSSSSPSSLTKYHHTQPIHTLDQRIAAFTTFLAAKEDEFTSLCAEWDDNTRQIEAVIKEAQDMADSPFDAEELTNVSISPYAVLAAEIEQVSADAVRAMQAEVEDQRVRRKAVREKMLEVLREGMMGSQ